MHCKIGTLLQNAYTGTVLKCKIIFASNSSKKIRIQFENRTDFDSACSWTSADTQVILNKKAYALQRIAINVRKLSITYYR